MELTSKGLKDLKILEKIKDPSKLIAVNFWDNKISSTEMLEKFVNLREIHFRENLLHSVANFPPYPQLTHLSLRSNSISGGLPKLDLPNLDYLDLSFNKLTDISNLAGITAKNIRFVIFLANELTALPPLDLPEVMFYLLTANKITSFDGLRKSRLPKLNFLYLDDNKVNEDLTGLKFEKIKTLKLNGNQIEGIGEIADEAMPEL